MPLFDEFNDPVSGAPMLRIYQARVPVPVKGPVGELVTVTLEGRTFRGVIKQVDTVIAILALG